MQARRSLVARLSSITLALGLLAVASSPLAAAKGSDTTVKVSSVIKPKIDAKVSPFKWGLSTADVLKALDDMVDEQYADKIAAASSSPKREAALDKEKDKKKKLYRDKLSSFVPGKGVSGYEMVTPGEFTYGNNEQVLELTRDDGGTRCLFFIRDRLYKIYDVVALESKDGVLGQTWEQAVTKEEAALGDKGKRLDAKSTLASYYGVMTAVPALVLWSDGTSQVRLVDHTHREDSSTRQVGVAYEDIATVEKLSTYRTHLESKTTDSAVERAGAPDPLPAPKKKTS
jgi:hypothetical protein